MIARWGLTAGFWPPRLDPALMRRMAGYGGANLVMRICELLTFQCDQILIVQAVGPAAVAQYQVGRFLALHSRSFVTAVTMVLAPYFTALSAAGEQREARDFFLRLAKWIHSLAAVLLAGIICLGQVFLRLWVGPQYTAGDWWGRSDVVLVIFALAMAIRSFAAVPYQFLLGTRRLRVLTLVSVVEAVFVVAGGAVGVRWNGIAALALVKLISSLFFVAAVLVPYSLREIQVDFGEYFRKSVLPGLLAGIATVATALWMAHLVAPAGWASFFASAAASGAAGAAAFILFGTGPKDREFIRRKLHTPMG
jgi:O-antigen/teichoic acid export membrane protein